MTSIGCVTLGVMMIMVMIKMMILINVTIVASKLPSGGYSQVLGVMMKAKSKIIIKMMRQL